MSARDPAGTSNTGRALYWNLTLLTSLATLAFWVGGQAQRINTIEVDLSRMRDQQLTIATSATNATAKQQALEQVYMAGHLDLAARVARIEGQIDQGDRTPPKRR